MKKSALLITGQLRTFFKTFENILNNVIIPNSFDVFLYIDCPIRQDIISISEIPSQVFTTPQIVKYRYMTLEEDKEYSIELDKIMSKSALLNSMLVESFDLYLNSGLESNAIEIIEKYENENNIKYSTDLDKNMSRSALLNSLLVEPFYLYLKNSGSILEYFHYSKGMEMIEKYENENNIKYEYIMRGRFDMAFTEPFHVIKFFELLPTVVIGPSTLSIEHHPDDKSCPRDHCGKKGSITSNYIKNIGKIFKSVCEYGILKSDSPSSLEYIKELQNKNGFFNEKINNVNSIFTIRHNVIWCGRRQEMDKLRKLFEVYGDYHIGASRTWDSETQFHQFLMLNDINHIDYFSTREKDIYNEEKNKKFLSDPEEALFALIR